MLTSILFAFEYITNKRAGPSIKRFFIFSQVPLPVFRLHYKIRYLLRITHRMTSPR
ncbi:hypothetical protein BF1218 [Bacteroides fragilis YCH46]|uniref:Uncharacterized protein n=1 Tax=Bacteroides fragilis (strain YCH46) TaxID=295405 RepID=Q64X08_BACFR|nr:hypothetical protein BF1218 [Bacteroides fragilis YCH46]